jgi:hypothetical protein
VSLFLGEENLSPVKKLSSLINRSEQSPQTLLKTVFLKAFLFFFHFFNLLINGAFKDHSFSKRKKSTLRLPGLKARACSGLTLSRASLLRF